MFMVGESRFGERGGEEAVNTNWFGNVNNVCWVGENRFMVGEIVWEI